jgi:hypothetical protein
VVPVVDFRRQLRALQERFPSGRVHFLTFPSAWVAAAVRDERINELQQQVNELTKQNGIRDAASECDTETVVQYVIAECASSEIKVRQVIDALTDALTAYLEQRPS